MMVVASAVAMGWLSVVAMGSPVLHKVGGSKGWINHDVNYTEWAAQEHVYVGDWLSKCIINLKTEVVTVIINSNIEWETL